MINAVIGRCEAVDIVPTVDDAVDVRCRNGGVKIREFDGHHYRHRVVCRDHGYDPRFTPSLTDGGIREAVPTKQNP
jgi:hypothetical protein